MPTYENVQVVGMHFRGAEVKSLVATFEPPITFRLEREPDNAFDPNAVKVFYEDTHIGYINREEAAFISQAMLEDDYYAEFECLRESRNNLYPICTVRPE